MNKLCSQDEAKQNMTDETGRSRSLLQFYSLLFLLLVVQSHSCVWLWPHGLQHARPHCPHHLPEFAQVHVHCIGNAVQPSHPLMPSSALNVSQHQGFFQWVLLKLYLFTLKLSLCCFPIKSLATGRINNSVVLSNSGHTCILREGLMGRAQTWNY